MSKCFYMKPVTVGGTTQWAPIPGQAALAAGTVPQTAVMEIVATPLGSVSDCGYDFDLYYQFDTIGGSFVAANDVKTRLINLGYSGGGVCP